MRIVHISTIHQPLDVRIFMKECRSLAAHGYEVHLIIQNPPCSERDGVVFHGLNLSPELGKLQRFIRRYTDAWRLAFYLQGDVYHFHDPELIFLGLSLKLWGYRVIYDVHEDAPREAISLNKDRPWFGRLKSLVWSVMEALAKQWLDRFVCVTPAIATKFPSQRTLLVRNFPLIQELQAYEAHPVTYIDRVPLLVYAGGITKIRGICEILAAMPQLPLNSRLKLLGHFSPNSLETEMTQTPGWQHVDFLGWQPRSVMIEQIGQTRVGLLLFHPEPDHLDAMPNKLFEYMSAGIPLVASDFPLWRQLIEKVDCGVLVNPLDPDDIATKVTYLLNHPEIAAKMGKNGQNSVRQTFNWEAEVKPLLAMYQTLHSKPT